MPSFQYVKIYSFIPSFLLYNDQFFSLHRLIIAFAYFWINSVSVTPLLQSKITVLKCWIGYLHTKLKAMDFPQLLPRAHFPPRCSITNALCTEHCFLNMLERKEAGK